MDECWDDAADTPHHTLVRGGPLHAALVAGFPDPHMTRYGTLDRLDPGQVKSMLLVLIMRAQKRASKVYYDGDRLSDSYKHKLWEFARSQVLDPIFGKPTLGIEIEVLVAEALVEEASPMDF